MKLKEIFFFFFSNGEIGTKKKIEVWVDFVCVFYFEREREREFAVFIGVRDSEN